MPAVDQTGLTALLEARRTLREAAHTARLAGVARRLSNLLVIARLVTLFDSFVTVEDAIADVRMQLESASARARRGSLLAAYHFFTALHRI